MAGFSWCPGCGIGHALSCLLHGQVVASWQYHGLGIPALLTIFYRIYGLSFKQMFNFRKLKLNRHGF
uniref:DUF2752 domain-containing protein n=1 Tax=Mucilaginibacter sp. Bleaf8 TaxID=2834430 RepID=UPI0020BF1A9A|nr:DUF2752 domain-containing protein [Mucilaginibacter sp. Bleaf8]